MDRETKQVIAQGLCEDGLYVLRDTPMALAATVGVSRKASFELWHNRLGHVSFDVISTLNKLGVLDVTSILPKPNICKPCQLSKSQRLPFELNSKRSSYPLDLIHCDLWGPAPVSSDGYLYYVIFVDDYSRFTWFYPLKTKSGFYTVLSAFIKLVQTQLSRKIKVFQSDGGTEFVNHMVRKFFEDNGTLHRLSCPYTPQQNGRAERKYRHLVKTGLAMLFHAHVPASYWVDAFSSATYIINRLPTKLLDILTINDKVYPTNTAACEALGLLGDDREWKTALQEAAYHATAAQLRLLFVQILVFCEGRQQRQQNYSRGGGRASNSNGGRGRGGRRPPHCQLCRTNGHYASSCPSLHTYASNAATSDANLAQAFTSQCHVTQGHPDWYVDSGATAHMTSSPDNVSHSAPHSGNMRVFFGNGDALPVSHIGQSMVSNKILLRDVLVIPKLTKNLLSISKLTMDHPVDVLFSQPFFNIQDRETKQVIAQGLCEDGLYVLRDTPMALAATVGVSRKASFELWHNRLGHVSFDVISTLNKLGVLDVTSILPKPNICKPCQLSKSQRLPFELNSKRSSYPLDLIHCDLWGPAPVSSDGYLYYVIFVDDYSRFTWFYPLKTKSGFYTVLSAFIKLVQTQLSRKIKVFQSDGGTEFVNHTVRKIFEDNGTLHRLSCPYTPQQNGRAERKHRHLVETGLAMLFHAHVPASYWVDAFSSATYIINRLPTKLLGNHSPFELLYSRLPNYTNFRAFGCLVYPYLRDYSAHKLAPRSIPCVFIGYNPQYKGYKCLDPDSSRIYITRHARFDEVTFPFASTANPNALSTLQLCTFLEDGPPISDAPVPESRPTDTRPSSSSPCGLCPVPTTAAEPIHEPDSTPSSPYSSEDDNPPTDSDDVSSHGAPPAPPATAPTEPSSVHQMKTRSKSGIFKTKHSPDFVSLTSHALHAALFSLVQPKGFKSAAKHPQWMAAMHDEMEALKQNCTWTLVPRPSASNIVGSKWVYRIKYHADGSVERFKARVVAQGFTQIPGLDYSHTFSPVVKASTVRIVLSLAVLHRWRLHQLDVKNAFLHGHLNETVYMEQPPGFIDPQFPNHVCKLSKALYGLKQAPRAWFHRLSSFLLAHGFVCSRADTSLFVFTKDSCIMYLLVYVDDLILTGNNESLLTSFTTRLNQEFAIKDLGDLSYFLGLEVSYTNDGLFLSQAKYATDVLTRAALLDSKPVSTPLAANEVFVTGGSLFANPTLYRSLVGALQYLTITRPDLSYAVNQASQFLHAPTDAHFQSVKRILRYVKGTITYGLIFRRPHSNSILGYSDADWARCIETRRSTYGYSIFLGGNLVSWSAKKQPTVSRSSCESEYRAMANTAAEIIWITHLLRELHALPPDRPTLLCDNKSALFMSQNPVSHKRAKHIDLDYHFVRELVASGKLYTKFIPTKLQVADIFTKSLPRPQFEYFWSLLRLGPPPIHLRGDIR
ncbi:retrovirus-related pol polyprotein from transposon TNT 1-94 [Tanacetum coccineum]